MAQLPHPCLSPWKGAVIGGLVAFVWNTISWMALPFHGKTLKTLSDPLAIAAALPSSGIYVPPPPPEGAAAPFLFVAHHAAGWGNMGLTMLTALVLYGFGSFWWTWVLGKIPGLTGTDSAKYGAMFGLALGALGAMPYTVWWKFPFWFSFLSVLDGVIIWTIASPMIARWGQASVCALPPART